VTGGGPIQVLVVDDSAVVRQALTSILGRVGLYVTTASDPVIAREKLKKSRPHVIVLDVEMPRVDGLTFLREVMAADPIPVIICSGLAGPGSDVAVQALEEGAVEIVTKPQLGVKGFLEESATRIVQAVRAAAQSRPRLTNPRPVPRHEAGAVLPVRPATLATTTLKVIAIGASTGGTEAIRVLLEALPPDAPGVLVVQHMPELYTAAFARRLATLCRIEVKEAADGDRVTPGRALIAPGNRHLAVRRSGAIYHASLLDGPPVNRHRPSVDVLFRSVAQVAGRNGVGVLLTGMGSDGAQGLLEMRQAGAHTVAEDERTAVVFGMPKEAIALGAAADVLPLDRIADRVLDVTCVAVTR
jgi:two-component system, chemotaxis family, protein-glutamate methylesterase/glutaminase